MRKRTDDEMMRLVLEYEYERINHEEGEETQSLFDIVVEYGLEGDEQPEYRIQNITIGGWDFSNASITEEEFCEELYEPVAKIVHERNQKRWERMHRIIHKLMKKKKEE
mgnify:CR=1 FL=1|jgi:hypothetical protein|tara:strand:+ start:2979 stop:3305 length:327 start_codon:yes stop_codon:yes gene_type:complete